MKRVWVFQYLILKTLLLFVSSSKSYYTVIAPGTIKSNRKYTVAVSLHDAKEACTIKIGIEGPSFNDNKDVYLQPFETKQIDFLPYKLRPGDYKLIAEGISGVQFKNESSLLVESKYGPKIYIQTDKGVYKPKDFVQFRVVVLDEHTRPLKIKEPIHVEILDALDNRVKQFKDIRLVKGVYTGHFQLSEYPVLGSWQIKVIITGKYAFNKSKSIKIQKYTLPRFSVHLKAPAVILYEEDILKIGIYGRYTYDKYVAGYAHIEIWDTDSNKLLQEKHIEIENFGSVTFHLKDLNNMENIKMLKVKGTLTEYLTGITQEIQHFVKVKKEKFQINIPTDEIEFRNNTPYRLKAHVNYYTGAPVLNHKTPVIMEHGNKRYEAFLNGNGLAVFDFEHQALADHKFTFQDAQQVLPNILVHKSLQLNETENYCYLRILGGSLRLGKNVDIEVSSITNIPYLVYTVIGHGNIVRMQHVEVPKNQKSFVIQLTPSIEMIPNSIIYVHYILNGTLRYGELELIFPHEFENQISIEAPKEIKPGGEVTINLKAQPQSYVSILAVDLSVYLLDSSYDLKKMEILEDLLNDKTYTKSLGAGASSGVITFTNALNPTLYAFDDVAVKPAGNIPLIFRKRFPETWIFQDLEVDKNITQLNLKIPDTVTTWRITAFSNNDITGFGIVNEPTDIITIQPFFITLNLPYSVKRGEIVAIPIVIFNYHDQSLETKVIMFNPKQEFYFMESNVQDAEKSNDDQQQIKHITVPFDGGKTVLFYITPRSLGDIELKISATNSLYSDGIVQKLKVEPEGVVKQFNKSKYFSIPSGENFSSFFFIEFPTETIPDSEYITLSVGGDYMVPTLDDFHNLIQMPTGCGEQNMVNFAPNILILEYLKLNGKLSKEKALVNKIRSFIDIGYQQQLSFRHRNGGYSVFGENSDLEPSSWLTAYVVRYFIKSIKYSAIEPRVIEADLNYLAQQQKPNGEFIRTGYLFSPTHQNKYGFTAFVLLTFLEDRKYALKYKETIQKGLQFLNSNLDTIRDTYALAIIACALKTAKDSNANNAIEKLRQRSKTDGQDHMWWSGKYKNTANDVEITAYALMALLDTPGDHTGILKWLLLKRNKKGGFKSTQDTVVGLQALVKFSENHKNLKNIDLKIKYRARDREGIDVHYDDFTVDAENVLVLQQHELPQLTRYLSFEATGTGHALVQLSYQYHIMEENQYRYFNINPNATLLNANELDLAICFSYLDNLSHESNTTNMVVMEVNLPSGFRSDIESNFDIDDHDTIQRIESKNSETTIILYFDHLLANVNHCINILADKITDIAMMKPAAIIIYDYYNLTRSTTEFYKI